MSKRRNRDIKYRHPDHSPCSQCGCQEWTAHGHSPNYILRYRRCKICLAPIVVHADSFEDEHGRVHLMASPEERQLRTYRV